MTLRTDLTSATANRPRRPLLASGALLVGGVLLGVTNGANFRDHWFDPVFLGALAGWGLIAWGTYEQWMRRAPEPPEDFE